MRRARRGSCSGSRRRAAGRPRGARLPHRRLPRRAAPDRPRSSCGCSCSPRRSPAPRPLPVHRCRARLALAGLALLAAWTGRLARLDAACPSAPPTTSSARSSTSAHSSPPSRWLRDRAAARLAEPALAAAALRRSRLRARGPSAAGDRRAGAEPARVRAPRAAAHVLERHGRARGARTRALRAHGAATPSAAPRCGSPRSRARCRSGAALYLTYSRGALAALAVGSAALAGCSTAAASRWRGSAPSCGRARRRRPRGRRLPAEVADGDAGSRRHRVRRRWCCCWR